MSRVRGAVVGGGAAVDGMTAGPRGPHQGQPRLLDLFCGAGGATKGYQRAGFYVVGVDIKPQPNYCGDEFVQDDAMTYPPEGFDVIHASPPCQAYTMMRHLGKRAGDGAPDLLKAVRDRFDAAGVPWVIENVVGAPMRNPLKLCGSSFRLGVRRHRLFDSSHLIFGLPCRHREAPRPLAVYGDHPQQPGDKMYRVNRARTLAEGSAAMGIAWMVWCELTQAIPPAYTEWIGGQLLRALSVAA